MNHAARTAFDKMQAGKQQFGLPWQSDPVETWETFLSGWLAHGEALKQADMFPGTLSHEATPVSVQAVWVNPPEVTAEAIYDAYPRKVGKQAAVKAIMKAIATINKEQKTSFNSAAWLLNRVNEFFAAVAKWPAADKQYIPHPATWFNRGSYDDSPDEWVRGAATTSQFSRTYK